MRINSGDIETLFNTIYPFASLTTGKNSLYCDKDGDKFIIYTDIPLESLNVVVIIHGWWGNINSPICLRYISFLKKMDWGIICISLKDHVKDYSLSRNLFSFDDINYIETIIDVYRKKYKHLLLIGFSFGANLALRLKNINKVDKAILISPVIDIKAAFDYIETKAIYKNILVRKWKSYLNKKQNIFPEIYDFSSIMGSNTIRDIVNGFIRYVGYNTVDDYFLCNNVTSSHIQHVEIPTLIIHAQNDPIIPISNLNSVKAAMELNRFINLIIPKFGGHCPYCKKEVVYWLKRNFRQETILGK